MAAPLMRGDAGTCDSVSSSTARRPPVTEPPGPLDAQTEYMQSSIAHRTSPRLPSPDRCSARALRAAAAATAARPVGAVRWWSFERAALNTKRPLQALLASELPAVHSANAKRMQFRAWLVTPEWLLVQVYGSGVALAMVACVPDWPWFNRTPQKWQVAGKGNADAGRKRAAVVS